MASEPAAEQEEAGTSETFSLLNFSKGSVETFPKEQYESISDTLLQYLELERLTKSVGTSDSKKEPRTFPEPVIDALKQYVQLRKQWEANPNRWQFKPAAEVSQQPDEFSWQTEDFPVYKPSEEEIERHIQAVLEMLPDLGAGFVLKCLERMDYKPEQVIARVLDESLPTELSEVPRDLARGASTSSATPGSSRTVQKKPEPRRFTVHIGKKPEYKDAKDLLDDKKAKEDIKDFVLKASYSYNVDDEYDDRQEIYNTVENSDDESKIYRHLKQPDVREYDVVSDPSSSSDEEPSAKGMQDKPRDAFCEDPAVVRARREAQRGRTFKGPPRDVTGRPKGQGQDKNVQQNREKKNVHKSSRANHNRKGGAHWKRSKGMVPS